LLFAAGSYWHVSIKRICNAKEARHKRNIQAENPERNFRGEPATVRLVYSTGPCRCWPIENASC